MQTYQCAQCGDEVTIGDGHRCRSLRGIATEPQFKHTECDQPVGLTAMLEANAHDEDVCSWLQVAKVGDVTHFGGQGCVECRRVA